MASGPIDLCHDDEKKVILNSIYCRGLQMYAPLDVLFQNDS